MATERGQFAHKDMAKNPVNNKLSESKSDIEFQDYHESFHQEKPLDHKDVGMDFKGAKTTAAPPNPFAADTRPTQMETLPGEDIDL